MKARRHSILIWILGISGLLIAVVIGALVLLVQSEWLESEVRSRAIETLESRFNAQVEIRGIDLNLWDGSVQIHDLHLANRAFPEAEPAVEIPTITVNFSILDLLAERPDLDRILLDRPIFRLVQNENGRLNLLNMFAPEAEETPSESPNQGGSRRLILELLAIDQGSLSLNHEVVQFSTIAQGLDLDAFYQRKDEHYAGSFELRFEGFSINKLSLPISTFVTDFRLYSDRLELEATQIESDSLRINTSGEFSSLSQLDYRFEVDLDTDLGVTSTFDFLSVVSSGKLHTNGQFLGRGSEMIYQGETQVSDLKIDRFSVTSLSGNVKIDKDSIVVEQLAGEYLDGMLSVGGQLYWKETASRFSTTLKGARIGRLLRLLEAPPLPVSGNVTAAVDFTWPALEFSELEGSGSAFYTGRIRPSDATEDSLEIPFAGDTQLYIDTKRLGLSEGHLQTPRSTALYQLDLPYSENLSIQTDLRSEDASELLKIAELFGLLEPELRDEYPFGVAGSATIQAGLQLLDERGLSIEADARLDRVSYNAVDLGRVSGKVRYESGAVSLEDIEVVSKDYSAAGSLTVPRTLTIEEPLRGRVKLEDAPIERLRDHFGEIPEELEGQISGQGEFSWSPDGGWAVQFQARAEAAEAWGESIDRITVDGELRDQTVQIRSLELEALSGALSGTAQYDLNEGETTFDLKGDGLDLAWIQGLRSEEDNTPAIEGTLSFRAQGAGRYPDLEVDLDARLPTATLAGQVLENINLTSKARQQSAQVDLGFETLGMPFRTSGTLRLEEPYSFVMRMGLDAIPIETVLRETTQEEPELSGTLTGKVVATGTLTEPSATLIELDLEHVNLITKHSPVAIRGIDTVQFQNGILQIPGIHITGQGTDLTGSGQLDLKEDGKISLKIEGEINLQLTGALLDEGAMSGLGIVDTDIIGSLKDPRIVGNIQIENGELSHPTLPISLSNVQGDFKFTTNQISIDSFSTDTAYGPLSLEGGVFLEGFVPKRWQVNAYGYGLRFEYVQGLVSILDVNLDLVKSETSQLISGAIYIRSAEYLEDISVADLILRLARGRAAALPTSGPDEIALDIDIESYRSLRVQNNLADIVASGDFAVVGTLNNPVILGTLTVDEGNLFFEGNTYDVTRGILSFNNPRVTTPYLNIEAETEVREFTVTILLRGSTEDLKTSFRSDPPLSTTNIITLLTSGQTQEELFGTGTGNQTASSSLAMYGAGTLLSRALGEAISTQTNRLFGLNKFSIDPFVDSSSDRDPGARVTLGKTITKGLDVTYITNLGGDLQDQTLIVEYRLTNWLTLVGTSQSDGTVAMDFKFRKRF